MRIPSDPKPRRGFLKWSTAGLAASDRLDLGARAREGVAVGLRRNAKDAHGRRAGRILEVAVARFEVGVLAESRDPKVAEALAAAGNLLVDEHLADEEG